MKIYDLPTLTILRFSNHTIVCFKLWWYASERLYFLWTYTLHLMMILYHPINPKLDLDPNPKWKVAPICTWKQLWKDRSKSNDRTGGSKLYYIKLSERVFIMWSHMQQTQIILHIRAISYGFTFSPKPWSHDKIQILLHFEFARNPNYTTFSRKRKILARKCSIIWVSSKFKMK